MEWGFDHSAKSGRSTSVSINALRGQVFKQLENAESRSGKKGISGSFSRNARHDLFGDLGILNGIVIGAILAGPVLAALPGHEALTDTFNSFHAGAIMEGLSAVRDEDAQKNRQRKLNDYPEGRRACALEALKRTHKKFNLVAANQNMALSTDIQAEIACLHEILDMLDKVEREGVTMICISPERSVYDTLKQANKKMFGKGAVRSYAAPMRAAV